MAKEKTVKQRLKEIDKKQLKMGKKVELEHSGKKPGTPETNVTNGDPKKTKKIAQIHLLEVPDYYTRLDKMEKQGKKAVKAKGKK